MLKKFIKQCWPVMALIIAVFGLGAFLGALGVETLSKENVNQLTSVLDNFNASISDISTYSTASIKTILINNIITWSVIYFLGLTVIGVPMVLILVFMRGFNLGFTIAFLLAQKAKTATILAVTSIIPHNLLFLPAIFISSIAALSFSILIIKRLFNNYIPIWTGLIGYTGIMLAAGILYSAAALVEAFITPWIIQWASSVIDKSWSIPF